MRINTNIASLTAQTAGANTNKTLGSSLEKLSSGFRINKASDDASGLAIADKLRTQASSLKQSISNATSAVALVQIADGAMQEQSNILDTIKSKLVQAADDATSAAGKEAIRKDVNKLIDQLDNIAVQTNYNGTRLLQGDATAHTGAATTALEFQIGETSADKISTAGSVQANSTGLGLDTLFGLGADALDKAASEAGMTAVDAAITKLNGWRSDFGSTQNQLESSIRNMMTTETNIKAAESVIRDVDYAAETANFNKQNIIAQAGSYAASQANAIQQNVLKLLQ